MPRIVWVVTGLLTLAMVEVGAQSPAVPERSTTPQSSTELLDRLVGDWRMVGHVRGQPVTYDLVARRVLGGRYVELHMTDVTRPPRYEARVFVGVDTVPGQVIVHWLDSFGAAFSVPHAVGKISGDTLQFEFPYRTGPFRDTFIYRASTRDWMFRLEAGAGSGSWRIFAEYEVRPAAGPPPADPPR